MRLEINDEDFRALNKNNLRAAAYFLLHIIGDVEENSLEQHEHKAPEENITTEAPFRNSTLSIPPTLKDLDAKMAARVPPPPSIATGNDEDDGSSNVVNFPKAAEIPPPPPVVSSSTNANTAEANTTAFLPPATVAAAVSTAASAGYEYDTEGTPWDERIHSVNKTKNQNGTWRTKKGVDPSVVHAVKSAHLAAGNICKPPTAAAGSLPPGDNSMPVSSIPPPPASNSVPTQNGSGASVPLPPGSATGTLGADDGAAFRNLINKVTELTTGGKISATKISQVCVHYGVATLSDLAKNPAKIPDVDKGIDAAVLGLI